MASVERSSAVPAVDDRAGDFDGPADVGIDRPAAAGTGVDRRHAASRMACHERRVEWWREYRGVVFCVFGHYSLAEGKPRGSRSAFCVDYGVGKRVRERRAGKADNLSRWLAAMRFPERVVVFDNGLTYRCGN